MERERAHFRKNSSELFICLSSSSSMKLSKSILSPAHRLRPNKASPFFPKKRVDNPEPSSPKVTCIGQVRVKTKKKKKKKKGNRSRRAEVSFKKIEAQQRSQGWVHLPVSICDALRTCFSVEGKRREIELVVGGGYEDDDENVRRRHVLEDVVVEEEAARVSICIPPKNALLLMRCRSDPMKMAALTNRFHIQQIIKEEELEIYEVEHNVVVQEEEEEENAEQLEECCPIELEESSPVCHLAAVMEEEAELNESINEGEEKEQESSIALKDSILLDKEDDGESSILVNESILVKNEDEDEEKEQESSIITVEDSILSDKEKHLVLKEEESTILLNNENEEDKDEEKEKEKPLVLKEEDEEQESILLNTKEDEEQQNEISEKEKPLLPECLLLMMREPKLSMEVSRETWVCSTDFTTRRRASDQKRLSFDSKAKRIQPPRSSCSLASMIQQKLANAAAHEPLVLTRCKSAPMRVVARAAGVGV